MRRLRGAAGAQHRVAVLALAGAHVRGAAQTISPPHRPEDLGRGRALGRRRHAERERAGGMDLAGCAQARGKTEGWRGRAGRGRRVGAAGDPEGDGIRPESVPLAPRRGKNRRPREVPRHLQGQVRHGQCRGRQVGPEGRLPWGAPWRHCRARPIRVPAPPETVSQRQTIT